VIWHTTHDCTECVGAPQHTRISELYMALPVIAPMLIPMRELSRYGSSLMPLRPLLHVMILPVHSQHPCLVSIDRSQLHYRNVCYWEDVENSSKQHGLPRVHLRTGQTCLVAPQSKLSLLSLLSGFCLLNLNCVLFPSNKRGT
jgi:hypothetical protein